MPPRPTAGEADTFLRHEHAAAPELDDVVAVDFHVDIPWSELPGRYREMDVFAMPCRNRWLGLEQEGLGIVFLEAMAAGLPIVAADCGAVPESAPHGEVSILVAPDDVEGLAAALVDLLTDVELRDRLAAGGAARWRRFGWPQVAGRFLSEVGFG